MPSTDPRTRTPNGMPPGQSLRNVEAVGTIETFDAGSSGHSTATIGIASPFCVRAEACLRHLVSRGSDHGRIPCRSVRGVSRQLLRISDEPLPRRRSAVA
jgi:hypothetical protein